MAVKDRKKSLYADLSMLIVAIIWGGGFVAVKDALNTITPFYIMTLRFLISAVLMCIIFFKRIKKITKKDIKGGSIVGVFLFLGFAFQTVGLKYTSAGKQAFLTGTYVIIVPFLYWIFMRKRPSKYSFIGAFLTIIGIGMISIQSKLNINLGDMLTLICAVFFALQIVAIEFFTKDIDPIILTVVQLSLSAILSFICTVSFESVIQPLNKQAIFSILYLGVFSTMIAFIIQNVAQKYTYSTHAAIILSLESVFGLLLSVILLHEVLTVKMIIGCALIFIAIITTEVKEA